MLQRPDRNVREIEDATCSVIEVVDFQAVVENSDATKVSIVHRRLRGREPPGSERGYTRNAIEQIDETESAGREELRTIPLVLRTYLVERGVGEASDRRFDRIRFDCRAVGAGVRFRLNRNWNLTSRRRHHLRHYRRSSPVQKRPGHEAEAGGLGAKNCAWLQRDLPLTNSMKVPVGTPVGPLGIVTRSLSEYAVPAMSRCAQVYPSANSLRNMAAVVAPAGRPPEFLMSATSDLISSLYSSHSGSGQPGSPALLPAARISAIRASSVENTPLAV